MSQVRVTRHGPRPRPNDAPLVVSELAGGPVFVGLGQVGPPALPDDRGEEARRISLPDRLGMLGRREEPEPVGLGPADDPPGHGLLEQGQGPADVGEVLRPDVVEPGRGPGHFRQICRKRCGFGVGPTSWQICHEVPALLPVSPLPDLEPSRTAGGGFLVSLSSR